MASRAIGARRGRIEARAKKRSGWLKRLGRWWWLGWEAYARQLGQAGIAHWGRWVPK